MLDVLRVLCCVAPFLLAVFAVYKANAAKVNRYRQLFLPLIAVAYGIVMLATLDGWHYSLQALLSSLQGWVRGYVTLPFSLTTAYVEAIVFNCVFLLGFIIIKGLYALVLRAVATPFEEGLKGLFGKVYEYDEEYGHWYLRSTFVGVRRLFKNLFITAVLIALILFLCTRYFPDVPAFQNPFYPSFAVLILGELLFFLDGITKEEYKLQMGYEDDQSTRVFQFAKVQKSLEHYFSDRLLNAFSRGRRRSSTAGHIDFCEDLSHSAKLSERLAGAYFMSLTEKGLVGSGSAGNYASLDHDAVRNTIKLLDGRSVLFASPFYRDYLPYVFLPINAQLMRDAKVLVLCESLSVGAISGDLGEHGVEQYVHDGLAFVTNVPDLWTVAPLNPEGTENVDVALMPFALLGDAKALLANKGFFQKTGFVLILDPSSMLATYQIGLGILAENLARGDAVTYCVFDRNCDGLVDSLSHALRTNLVEVGATEYCIGASVGMLWDVDGEFLQHRLFSDVAHYLGMAPELGLVALRGQVSQVSWVSRNAAPVLDQRWILGQYYGELFGFAHVPQEQGEIDRRFEFYPDTWSMGKQENRFIVVEDEDANLFEAYRQFATRGTDYSFVNVLSPNYLLRAYMVDNADMLAKDPKALPAFAPDYSKSQRNVIFSIVMMMVQAERDVPEEEITALLKYAGALDNKRSIQEALEGMLLEHFVATEGEEYLDEQVNVRTVLEYDPASRDYVEKRYYSISSEAKYLPVFRALRNVPLVTEAPDGTELLLGARLYDHVYQLFLPGQYVTLEGKYYEVLSMSDDIGVVLRRAADHFTHRRYYRQLRHYTVGDWSEDHAPASMRTMGNIRIQLGSASIKVDTFGYLDMYDYGNLETAHRIEMEGIPSRAYNNKGVLRIDFLEASEAITTTLAVLMSEFVKTLYPKDHPFLAILAPCAKGLSEGILYGCTCPAEGSSVYIIEDSLVDLGLLSSFNRNIPRILELCWEFLDWHEEMMSGKKKAGPAYIVGEFPGNPEIPQKKRGLFGRVLDKIKNLFAGTQEPAPKSEPAKTQLAEQARESSEGTAEKDASEHYDNLPNKSGYKTAPESAEEGNLTPGEAIDEPWSTGEGEGSNA